MPRLSLAFLVLLTGCAFPAATAEKAETPRRADGEIGALIEKLGADDPQERDQAHARLHSLGRSAEAALEAATRQKDLEIAARARAILKELRRKPVRGFPASDLQWAGIFGGREDEPAAIYCLLGSGYLASPHSKDVAFLVERWLSSHSRARSVPVAAFESGKVGIPNEISKWTYLWVEDDEENLALHLIEQGAYPGSVFESPGDDLLVPAAEYREFLGKARKAQSQARKSGRGIWEDPSALSNTLVDPWQVLAGACLFEEDYAEAIVELKKGLEGSDRSAVTIWRAVAECHDKLGDLTSSIEAYDKSLAEGMTERAVLGKAAVLSRLQGHEMAVAWLQSLRKKHPSDDSPVLWLGKFHKSEGRYRAAIDALTPLLDEERGKARLRFDDEGALIGARTGKEAHWDFNEAAGELAECQFRAGELRSALRTATMGISAGQRWLKDDDEEEQDARSDAGDVRCRYVRSQALVALGRQSEALEDLEKAAAAVSAFTEHELGLEINEARKHLKSKKK